MSVVPFWADVGVFVLVIAPVFSGKASGSTSSESVIWEVVGARVQDSGHGEDVTLVVC